MNATESCSANPLRTAYWLGLPGRIVAAIGSLHCRIFHRAISRPVNGKYRCWRCLREFELEW